MEDQTAQFITKTERNLSAAEQDKAKLAQAMASAEAALTAGSKVLALRFLVALLMQVASY